tara:strand:- start:24719 stop:24865 length:147 start_codon:yes stop_codon:yes gene_type:complete
MYWYVKGIMPIAIRPDSIFQAFIELVPEGLDAVDDFLGLILCCGRIYL